MYLDKLREHKNKIIARHNKLDRLQKALDEARRSLNQESALCDQMIAKAELEASR
jgi:hypothetical protein